MKKIEGEPNSGTCACSLLSLYAQGIVVACVWTSSPHRTFWGWTTNTTNLVPNEQFLLEWGSCLQKPKFSREKAQDLLPTTHSARSPEIQGNLLTIYIRYLYVWMQSAKTYRNSANRKYKHKIGNTEIRKFKPSQNLEIYNTRDCVLLNTHITIPGYSPGCHPYRNFGELWTKFTAVADTSASAVFLCHNTRGTDTCPLKTTLARVRVRVQHSQRIYPECLWVV